MNNSKKLLNGERSFLFQIIEYDLILLKNVMTIKYCETQRC